MARPAPRSQTCDLTQARVRLRQATSLVESAQLVPDLAEDDDVATPSVVASLAVLSGIAASDAACCAKLKKRPRGKDHREAISLLRSVAPDGAEMAKDLERLLRRKDDAHYGMAFVSLSDARRLVEVASRLVAAATAAVESQ